MKSDEGLAVILPRHAIHFHFIIANLPDYVLTIYMQGGPQKVSHFQVSSLNRIKNRH